MRLALGSEDDAADVSTGLVALVVTVVELLVEALEREAVRRMESGALTDAEIERLGRTLIELEEEVARLKRENDIEDATEELREDLDGLVSSALVDLVEAETGTR